MWLNHVLLRVKLRGLAVSGTISAKNSVLLFGDAGEDGRYPFANITGGA